MDLPCRLMRRAAFLLQEPIIAAPGKASVIETPRTSKGLNGCVVNSVALNLIIGSGSVALEEVKVNLIDRLIKNTKNGQESID